jgi:hypothetical protein
MDFQEYVPLSEEYKEKRLTELLGIDTSGIKDVGKSVVNLGKAVTNIKDLKKLTPEGEQILDLAKNLKNLIGKQIVYNNKNYTVTKVSQGFTNITVDLEQTESKKSKTLKLSKISLEKNYDSKTTNEPAYKIEDKEEDERGSSADTSYDTLDAEGKSISKKHGKYGEGPYIDLTMLRRILPGYIGKVIIYKDKLYKFVKMSDDKKQMLLQAENSIHDRLIPIWITDLNTKNLFLNVDTRTKKPIRASSYQPFGIPQSSQTDKKPDIKPKDKKIPGTHDEKPEEEPKEKPPEKSNSNVQKDMAKMFKNLEGQPYKYQGKDYTVKSARFNMVFLENPETKELFKLNYENILNKT